MNTSSDNVQPGKTFHLFFLLLIFLLPVSANATTHPGSKPSAPSNQIRKHFNSPDMRYAPFMFWFWDAPLDSMTVRHRMENITHELLEQHLNPGYVHARMSMVGTPNLPLEQWLSPVWFKTFEQMLLKAESANSYISFCNDYWWPSGKAAGRVLQNNPDLWAVSLRWETVNVTGGSKINIPDCFFAVAAQLVDSLDAIQKRREKIHQQAQQDSLELMPHTPSRIASKTLRQIPAEKDSTWTAPEKGNWRIYFFKRYYHPGADGGRLNYLDRRLGSEFIKYAHQPYADVFPNELGKTIPGVFIDHEGDYGYKLAWSEDLEQHYQQKFNADVRTMCPLLVDTDIEGTYPKCRWQYFEAISDVYADFFKQVNDWCVQHGLYAISNLWEESLMWQAGAVGDFFKLQRTFSMPGTDCLALTALNPHNFKETQSVCEFESRRFQSEIMGGAGLWGFNPVSIKKVANAVITWGVNNVVPHAVYTTRKFDGHPWLPDWYTEHPWWPHLHLWSDFVRRASYINSHGHTVPDVLLLNPMDSVRGHSGPGVFDPAFKGRVPGPAIRPLPGKDDIPQTLEELKRGSAWWRPPVMETWFDDRVHIIDSVYAETINQLTRHRIEYLVADDHYLRQMRVHSGALVREPFRFKTVILPVMDMMSLDNAELLLSFAKHGGQVILLSEFPSASIENGLYDSRMPTIARQLEKSAHVHFLTRVNDIFSDSRLVRSHIHFLSQPFPMLQQHRRIDNQDFFWLANNTGTAQRVTLLLENVNGGLEKWDCETGEILGLAHKTDPKGISVRLTFEPYEAFWLVTGQKLAERLSHQKSSQPDSLILIGPWHVSIDPDDQPHVEHPIEIPDEWKNGTVQQLADWQKWELEQFSGRMDYKNTFVLNDVPQKTLIDLGNVHHCAALWINGQRIGARLWPPFRFDITNAIKSGQNQLRIRIGNLVNNSYGDAQPSGLKGPVRILFWEK